MEELAAFRARLRLALQQKRMTQSQLARTLGVRDATVSDWFNRNTMPGGAIMLQLPEILGVDGHWLLTGRSRAEAEAAGEAVEWAPGLSEGQRAQLTMLLETALRIVRKDNRRQRAAEEESYLRVREASADEQRALEAVQEHEGQPGQQTGPRRRQNG